MTAKISAISDNIGSLGTNKGEAFRFGDDTSGQLASFRNKIINGAFQIAQRGFGGSTSGLYIADRWTNWFSSGACNAVLGGSILGNVNPSLNLVGTGTSGGIYSRIEDVRTLNGKRVTVSMLYQTYSGSNTNKVCALSQNFGTGGSPSASVAIPSISDVTVGSRRIVTFDIPSTAGKTLGTNNNSYLELAIMYAGTFSIGIGEVQVEEGSIATPFEQRPIGLELSLCQRYYETGRIDFRDFVAGAYNFAYFHRYAVNKRVSGASSFTAAASASQNIAGTPAVNPYYLEGAQITYASAAAGDTFYGRAFAISAEL